MLFTPQWTRRPRTLNVVWVKQFVSCLNCKLAWCCSGACFIIDFTSLSPVLPWPSLAQDNVHKWVLKTLYLNKIYLLTVLGCGSSEPSTVTIGGGHGANSTASGEAVTEQLPAPRQGPADSSGAMYASGRDGPRCRTEVLSVCGATYNSRNSRYVIRVTENCVNKFPPGKNQGI